MEKQLIYFLEDLIYLLKEDAFDAKKEFLKNRNKKNADYYEGKVFGYWEALSTIKHQLIVFQIDPKKVKFDFDHDKEFIISKKE